MIKVKEFIDTTRSLDNNINDWLSSKKDSVTVIDIKYSILDDHHGALVIYDEKRNLRQYL